MLAALCLLLGLGAFRRKHRPTLVNEETNTDAGTDARHLPEITNNQDPLFYLQHTFAGGDWKHDTAFQGDTYTFVFNRDVHWCALQDEQHFCHACRTFTREIAKVPLLDVMFVLMPGCKFS